MEIYKKIFEAKKEIGTIVKDSKNPFFKSNYLSLNGLIESIEPLLLKNDLVLLQPIKEGLVCTQIVDINTGEMVESQMMLPNIQDPQKIGSAVTYFRRYTLQSLLGVNGSDDDGQQATKAVKEQRKPSLTDDKFEKAKAFTKEQIQQVLSKFRMTTKQREELTKLLK